MIDEQYVRDFYEGRVLESAIPKLVVTMNKYDFHWWESDDPVVLALYQLEERVRLIDFDDFLTGLRLVCGRPVYLHELALNLDQIKKEVAEGLKRNSSLEERVAFEREAAGIQTFVDYFGEKAMIAAAGKKKQ